AQANDGVGRQGMIARQSQYARRLAGPQQFAAPQIYGQADHANVRLPVGYRLDDVMSLKGVEIQLVLEYRLSALQQPYGGGQEAGTQRVGRSDPQRAALAARNLARAAIELLEARQDITNFFVELTPLFRHGDLGARACEQHEAKLLLQILDLPAYHGLGAIQQTPRRGYASCGIHGCKGFELTNFHIGGTPERQGQSDSPDNMQIIHLPYPIIQ